LQARITDELPRDRRRLGDSRVDLDPSVSQTRPDPAPYLAHIIGALEDGAKQRFTAFRDQPFDALGDLRCWVLVELKEVLQIPTDALAVLR
jgi:hypothetical protein